MQEKFPDDRLKMKTGNLRRDFYRQQRLLPKQLIIPSRTNIMGLNIKLIEGEGKMEYLLRAEEIPYGFQYPAGIYKLIELNLLNYDVWYFMDRESALERLKGVQERYPNRKLIPFARRDDCDDIACFEVGSKELEGRVFIIHDYASSGWESREVLESIWEWVKYAVDIMVEFELIEEDSI